MARVTKKKDGPGRPSLGQNRKVQFSIMLPGQIRELAREVAAEEFQGNITKYIEAVIAQDLKKRGHNLKQIYPMMYLGSSKK